MTDGNRLLRNLSIIGSGTMVSRLLGFVRDLLTAVWLGTGPVADAFIIAQRLPNLFRSLLAEGGINSVFVPQYNKELHDDPARAATYAAQITGWMLAILVPLVIIAAVFMDHLINVIAPGADSTAEVFNRAIDYSEVTIFYLIVICLTAMQGAVLNAHHSFGSYAAAPAILNITLIVTMFSAHQAGADIGMTGAWALLVGGILQTLFLDGVARRKGIRLGIARPRLNDATRAFFKNLGPGVLGMSAMNVNILVGTFFASWLPTGAIASLYYADRLNQLPLALIGAALGTVLLPTLTRTLHAGDTAGTKKALDQAVVTGLLLCLPVMLGMAVLGEPLVRLLFQHGAFSADDTSRTALALACYSLMLPASVLDRVLQCCSYARHTTSIPARAALCTIVIHAVLASLLSAHYGQMGIAVALTLAAWTNAILQGAMLYARGQLPLDHDLPGQILILLGGCALMYGIMTGLQPLLPVSGTLMHAFLHLVVTGGAGLTGYGVVVLCWRKKIFVHRGGYAQ